MLGNVASGLGPERLIPLAMRPMLPLVTLAALGIVLPLLRPSRAAALTGAYALATFLAVTLSGRFHPHYYQLWLPLLCIGGAVALAPLDRPEAGQGRALSVPAALVTAALLALFQ